MTSGLQTTESAISEWMSPKTMVARLNRMKEIMRTVMRDGTHYGTIPGCKQKSLYQPGSQVLGVAFMIGCEPENIEEFRDENEVRYRVKVRVFDQKTGLTIAYGIGECSSSEEKYAWRKPKGKEWDNTPEDRRRIKYLDDGEIKQVRTNPADVANTILKMSTKRSEIKGMINALAASEIFTQDIEDLPEGMDISHGGTNGGSTKPAVNPDDVRPSSPDPTGQNLPVGTVTGVFQKSGEKNGKKWTKYAVVINEQSFSTFDVKLAELAKSLKNQQVIYEFEQAGEFKNLKSVKKYEAPAPKTTTDPASKPETGQGDKQGEGGHVPEVESSEAFASTVMLFGAQRGLDEAKLAAILEAQFQCTIDTVPADLQKKVLEHLETL